MNDHEAVTLQLGREPIAFRVAARCPAGLPSVIENERRVTMPTSFWITCPTLRAAISRVEAAGGVRAAQDAIGAEAVDKIHAEHLARYGTRVAGIGDPGGRAKCLHAFSALHLAAAISTRSPSGPSPASRSPTPTPPAAQNALISPSKQSNCILLAKPLGGVAQSAEAADLKSVQCGFESHRPY